MLLYRVLVMLAWPLVWSLFRPRVRGREHLRAKGGLVICPTHLSGFDAFAIAFAMSPRVGRNMAKNELFRRSLVGALVRSLGAFPARDGDGMSGGVIAAVELTRRGSAVVIYPEGARRRGRDRRPRTGAARVALSANVPLVPAAIRGTDGWQERRRWEVTFGAPVDLHDLAGCDDNEAAHEGTRRLWASVEQLEMGLAK